MSVKGGFMYSRGGGWICLSVTGFIFRWDAESPARLVSSFQEYMFFLCKTFVSGGIITLFQCSIPLTRFTSYQIFLLLCLFYSVTSKRPTRLTIFPTRTTQCKFLFSVKKVEFVSLREGTGVPSIFNNLLFIKKE